MRPASGSPPAIASSALADLPAVVFALVPELAGLGWPDERRADCGRCVMLTAAGCHPDAAFRPDTRCCTYHPVLPNYQAGRALRRSPASRARIEARLVDPSGVSAAGIAASARWSERHRQVDVAGWGRDPELRCPYWAGGDATCGIWADRNGACRCWYCKHDQGPRGALAWMRLQLLLERIEGGLAAHVAAAAAPPAPGPRGWSAWFERSADAVEAIEVERLAGLRAALAPLVADLLAVAAAPPRALPEVVEVAVGGVARRGARVEVWGYSSFDAVTLPAQVFGFLAAVGAGRRWRDALADPAVGGALGADDVAELYRVGALAAPGEELVRDTWLLPAGRAR